MCHTIYHQNCFENIIHFTKNEKQHQIVDVENVLQLIKMHPTVVMLHEWPRECDPRFLTQK